MNKKNIASRFTEDDDEVMLLCRILDKYEAARNNGYLTYTGFLTDRVQILAARMLDHIGAAREEYLFDGGYAGASRKIALFLPDYMDAESATDENNSPLAFIRASYYREYTLTHRDFLGAILGSGISRDAVGDILVNSEKHTADIIINNSILKYMLSEFSSVGRARTEMTELHRDELYVPEQAFTLIKDTVASLRLDAVIAVAFGLSREKASLAVEKGLVELDHFPCQRSEKQLYEGAEVTVRGFGKFKLETVGSLSKKGRTFIEVKKYL